VAGMACASRCGGSWRQALEAQTKVESELDLAGIHGGFGVFELEVLHDVDQDAGDGDVPKVFVVGRNDEPRGVFAAGGGEKELVGLGVLIPELALLEVGLGEFPTLVRVVDAGLEAAGLLFMGDVEEELEDEDIVVGEHGLELENVFEVLVDFFTRAKFVDVGDEDVFVVRAVEDIDHAAGGNGSVGPP